MCLLPAPIKIAQDKSAWQAQTCSTCTVVTVINSILSPSVFQGKGDPGYWETSRMLLEAGLCLALQDDELKDSSYKQGGVLTPGSAMGMILAERIQKAMDTFKLQES